MSQRWPRSRRRSWELLLLLAPAAVAIGYGLMKLVDRQNLLGTRWFGAAVLWLMAAFPASRRPPEEPGVTQARDERRRATRPNLSSYAEDAPVPRRGP